MITTEEVHQERHELSVNPSNRRSLTLSIIYLFKVIMATEEIYILIKLLMEEIEAIQSYTSAIDEVSNPKIKARLIEIRNDEEEHSKELRDLLS